MPKLAPMPRTRLKKSLTPEEIRAVHTKVVDLLMISGNYECFGQHAARAEQTFGALLTLLEAWPE